MQEGFKKCFRCGVVKPLDEFYRHSEMADGHLGKCIDCAKADAKSYREHNQMAQFKTRKKAFEKKSSRYNLRKLTEAAINAGVLVKPKECSVCGRTGRIEAHHPSYSEPLNVVWLCPKCHAKADMSRRIEEGGPYWGRMQRPVACKETKEAFSSIADAARAVGRSSSSISGALKRGGTSAGLHWTYL